MSKQKNDQRFDDNNENYKNRKKQFKMERQHQRKVANARRGRD